MSDAENSNSPPAPLLPEPVPYQEALRDYLKTQEPELWNWFSSNRARAEHADQVRLDLLKTTYRIERETQPGLYATAEALAEQFGVAAPLTIYQAQSAGDLNAGLAFIPGEIHLILHGAVLKALVPVELQAMLGHELSHYVLWDKWDGEFLVTSEVVRALANDPAADDCHTRTARLLGLYTEIFADRGSLLATDDIAASVSTLVKLHTGLAEVSAESYLRQAEEIMTRSREASSQLTHPEPYIRARALQLWAGDEAAAHDEIARMIEGPPVLDALDLLGRKKVEQTTRRLIGRLLSPQWLQTDALLAHARLFFEDFLPAEANGDDKAAETGLAAELAIADDALRAYYCYVLLDFAAAERSLEDLPLSAALVLARRLDVGPRFSEIAAKELGLGKKQFAKIESGAERRVTEASAPTT
jgi:hypothetical protein